MKRLVCSLLCSLLFGLLSACDGGLWNNPYPAAMAEIHPVHRIHRASQAPRSGQAYSENEYEFLANIYAPPLQYHYLKRPYQLVPLAASAMRWCITWTSGGSRCRTTRRRTRSPSACMRYASSQYRYQPHPAFAPEYANLTPDALRGIRALGDFPRSGTRTVTAADYAYQIKRLAHPQLHLPIFGVMSEYIVGLKDYAATLQQALQKHPGAFLDLNAYRCRRAGGGRAHIPHRDPRQISAVRLLAGDAVLRADAAGGRALLCAGRDARAQPHAGLVAGRQRPYYLSRTTRTSAWC